MTMHFQVRLKALTDIRDANDGHLTPRAVVDASRPSDALLHHEFEWDDSVAAERHREEQARNIIRSIKIETVENEPRMFHAVIVDGEREYATIDEIRIDDALSQQVVNRLKRNVEAALRDLEYLQKPDFEPARPHLEAALHVLRQ